MCVRRVTATLEARERELLTKIEKARSQKHAALLQRDDGIKTGILRLTEAADKLSEVIESGCYIKNPLSLTFMKDRVSAEVLIEVKCQYFLVFRNSTKNLFTTIILSTLLVIKK